MDIENDTIGAMNVPQQFETCDNYLKNKTASCELLLFVFMIEGLIFSVLEGRTGKSNE